MANALVGNDPEVIEWYDFLSANNIPTLCSDLVLSSPGLYEGANTSIVQPSRRRQINTEDFGRSTEGVPNCTDLVDANFSVILDLIDTEQCNTDTLFNTTKLCTICIAPDGIDGGNGPQRVAVMKVTTPEKSAIVYKMVSNICLLWYCRTRNTSR
jgi:hypothetical protein